MGNPCLRLEKSGLRFLSSFGIHSDPTETQLLGNLTLGIVGRWRTVCGLNLLSHTRMTQRHDLAVMQHPLTLQFYSKRYWKARLVDLCVLHWGCGRVVPTGDRIKLGRRTDVLQASNWPSPDDDLSRSRHIHSSADRSLQYVHM